MKKEIGVLGMAMLLASCGNQEVTNPSTGITTFKAVKTVGGLHGTEANFDKLVARTARRICGGNYQELGRMPTGETSQQSFIRYYQYEVSVRCG